MKSKTFTVFLVAALLSTALFASFSSLADPGTTGNIIGQIKDSKGNAGVSITVALSNGMNTTTAINGGFEFTNVPAGNYSITADFNGRTITKNVTVNAGQTTDLGTLGNGIRLISIIILIVGILIAIAIVAVIVMLLLGRRRKRKQNEEMERKRMDQQIPQGPQ